MNYINENLIYLTGFIKENIVQIEIMKPDSTYMVWLDCRNLNLDDEALKSFFINKARIGLNSGITFGTGGSGFMRMNIACPKSILMEAMQRIHNAL